ncbi:MAG: methyltransferase domain-containing protein [Candidatus Aenigmatarchaeota archaeon]
MSVNVWKSEYFDVYDPVLLNSDIYLAVRDFHIKAMDDYPIVLDSGCGTGNVTSELLKNGHIVHAIDNSKKPLDILKRKCSKYAGKLHIHNMNVSDLSFEKEMFDAITSMFVVYYLNNIEEYLRENYRVLKTNGIFALTGRVSSDNMELVLQSYEQSLQNKELLPALETEFLRFKEKFLNNVTKAVNGNTFEEMKSILEDIGFRDITQYPNPYFGQCYSLIAHK